MSGTNNFQKHIPELSELHAYMCENEKSVAPVLAAALNLSIRFGLPGESRCPRHEAMAIACVLSTAIEVLRNSKDNDNIVLRMGRISDALFRDFEL
jgi:hypothetical protein